MSREQRLRLRLAITPAAYLAYYRYEADDVVAHTLDGRSIRFPARALRRHVTHTGVHGLFEIVFDADNRLVDLERIGD